MGQQQERKRLERRRLLQLTRAEKRPKLSVLMPALHTRDWIGLAWKIRSQITPEMEAELCVVADGGEMTSGRKRNLLLDMARGDYAAFVDDDDDVADNYVEALVAGCRAGRDVVTFDLLRYTPRTEERQTFGLRHQDHQAGDDCIRMTANHLCAWKRSVAKRARYDERIGYADDQLWYKSLIAALPDLTEYHIEQVLYWYEYDPTVTANQTRESVRRTKTLYPTGADVFLQDHQVVTLANPADEREIKQLDLKYVDTIHVH